MEGPATRIHDVVVYGDAEFQGGDLHLNEGGALVIDGVKLTKADLIQLLELIGERT